MKFKDTDFDCWHKDELVCPYCHYKFQDSWEYIPDRPGGDEEADCPECGKEFTYCAENQGYVFSSYKLEDEEENEDE